MSLSKPHCVGCNVPCARLTDRPLERLADDPRQCFEVYGYTLLRAEQIGARRADWAKTATVLACMVASIMKDAKNAYTIAGNVNQVTLTSQPHAKVWTEAVQLLWRTLLLDLMHEYLGIATKDLPPHVVANEGLAARSDTSVAQAQHFDAYLGWLATSLSCLLYCAPASADLQSTMLPRFPQSVYIGLDTERMTQAEKEKLWAYFDEKWYHQVRVHPGDILIFRQSVPHFGPKFESALRHAERVVLFSIASDSSLQRQDEHQQFRWQVARELFGPDSLEYADAMVRDAMHDPIGRLRPNEHDPTPMSDAMECLRKNGRYQAWREADQAKAHAAQAEALKEVPSVAGAASNSHKSRKE